MNYVLKYTHKKHYCNFLLLSHDKTVLYENISYDKKIV